MGCCESFARVLLFILNTIFFIVGAVVLAVGIWLAVGKNSILVMMRQVSTTKETAGSVGLSTDVIHILATVLIVVGTFTFVTGFCGCFGAWKKISCILYVYAVLVSIVVLVEIGIGIYAGVQQNKVESSIKNSFLGYLTGNFNGVMWPNSTLFTKIFTSFMFTANCCGVNGRSDFNNFTAWQHTVGNKSQENPLGCCKLNGDLDYDPFVEGEINYAMVKAVLVDDTCPVNQSSNSTIQVGCVDKIIHTMKGNLAIVIGVAIGLGFLEVLCIVVACVMARNEGDSKV